ncbi:YfbU family protein [Bifidobacterium sp. ESL0798]|uniref:YfbU family protein n=1 Tax=Bifidobacterium sp. ESL0798 TaxID=2983235 RepID=UPI0023F73F1D|nr:YfbU family protein [Bifidobacterium sp. ESL0798]WEV74239.1 YfbU family protein [Bifidobacterium sp. ESL0798]
MKQEEGSLKKNMVVVTARIDMDLKKRLDDYVKQTGSNRSEVIIRSLNELLDAEKPHNAAALDKARNDGEQKIDAQGDVEMEDFVPIYSLDVPSRLILSTLNRIAAAVDNRDQETGEVLKGNDLKWQSEVYEKAAKALEQGYAAEYTNSLPFLAPELSARQTNEINDVMEMFRDLLSSYNALTDKEKKQMPEQCEMTYIAEVLI